ncbi:MAG: DNA alkylation repair protein [Cytophagales bacterium]|nr:DNA alkylation repair protein [Cytophagales bacterium]
MAELLKNVYDQQFLEPFTEAVTQVIPNFDRAAYINAIFDDEWPGKELKQRMRHLAVTLHAYLTDDFEQNATLLIDIVRQLRSNGIKENSFEYMFLPDYIEVYGTDHQEASIQAMEYITQFTSCEFAVRPFILRYPEVMVNQLLQWAHHEHPMVRRLASEGSRPRLPWAIAIPAFKKDPGDVIPILEQLNDDESESVRRSVANNMNDIAKDNPDVVIHLAKKLFGKSKTTDWVVKHGCRTLLKQGNPEIMPLFGFASSGNIEIKQLEIKTPSVAIGYDLSFSFDLINKDTAPQLIRLEYAIYFMKANGNLSRKVFKISEREYDGDSMTHITRQQPFKLITTRKLYPGLHQVAVIVNGRETEKKDFQLIMEQPKSQQG